jgi:hypothetical protein
MVTEKRHRFSDLEWRKMRANLLPFVEIRLELGAMRGNSFFVERDAAAAEDNGWFEAIG